MISNPAEKVISLRLCCHAIKENIEKWREREPGEAGREGRREGGRGRKYGFQDAKFKHTGCRLNSRLTWSRIGYLVKF